MNTTEQANGTGEVAVMGEVITHGKSRFATDPAQWKSRLERFLDSQTGANGPVTVEDLCLPPASGGASSGTIIFTANYAATGRSEKLVLRYDPGESQTHEYDMVGQYQLLRALEDTEVPSPPVFGLDASGECFGVPGFIMGYIDGTALPSTYPVNGLLFDATPATRLVIVREIVTAMAKVHEVDWRSKKLDLITRQGKGRTALEKNIDWYRAAMRWGVPEVEPSVAPALQWLLDHQFEPSRLALCHGDTSPPNYMFKDKRLVAVLDWEFAFIGAPELDLGFQLLGHEVLMLGHKPLAGVPDIAGWCALYEEVSGHKLDHWHYYFTFACVKAVIHMALTFRGAPAPLDAARARYLAHTSQMMHTSWDAARG